MSRNQGAAGPRSHVYGFAPPCGFTPTPQPEPRPSFTSQAGQGTVPGRVPGLIDYRGREQPFMYRGPPPQSALPLRPSPEPDTARQVAILQQQLQDQQQQLQDQGNELRVTREALQVALAEKAAKEEELAVLNITIKELNDETSFFPLDVPTLVAGLDDFIIGQKAAKEAVAIGLQNRYLRQRLSDDGLRKATKPSHVLLTGPTGSGKTEIARRIAMMVKAPFAHIDITRYTTVDLNSLVLELLNDANKLEGKKQAGGKGPIASAAIDAAQSRGIIHVDEIDKICNNQAHAGEALQHALLPLLDGTDIKTSLGTVSTENILFICAGAFHQAAEHRPTGMLPELEGRLPVRALLKPLTEKDFIKILTETRYNLIQQHTEKMAVKGVEMIFETDAIETIAKESVKENSTINIGTRRLSNVMARVMHKYYAMHTEFARMEPITVTKERVITALAEPLRDCPI
ncbi:unnamed protein product [Vitrella brassicaformis CCMP3155]|uniref:AAA+ ATPase domain-containing protein n=2 Tax=Vitrella brassicaformis TaxID=1169539 RepID=A0A0G4EMQ7_VITBC|nr:unnamed protein product [Vitrella brassicaformis CCMP3155]|eukprot:CEL98297.1 unnamed protein product [Vitrella brassicaformis CCMP3155]